MKTHYTFEAFFDKIAWACITAIGLYAATTLKDMSTSILTLNTNTAVIIEKVGTQAETIKDHDSRIRTLEKR